MTSETLTEFFGWMAVLNFSFLAVSTVILLAFRSSIARLHAQMFGLDEGSLPLQYFNWLAQFKVLAVVVSFVPWLALKIM